MEDFGVSPSKIGESALKVVTRAQEEARRFKHPTLLGEHLFVAFAQFEWIIFVELMGDFNLNPTSMLDSVEGYLQRITPSWKKGLDNSNLETIMKLSLHQASRNGRTTIEPLDLFVSIFESSDQGFLVSLLQKHNVSLGVFILHIQEKQKEAESQKERLEKKFELPPFLKHFASNLNLLAALDRVWPVYGRDKEIQQVLEVLSHKERPNSVMLVGESGVGKTAIAEGLARRIEFEPETIPVRLRSCQLVSIQMNSLISGTQLRGMFEDRIQNVIRELKERPNLILFIDEAHTLVGAGSALGAPIDAANILKSVLARGEIRVIAATTPGEYKKHIEEDEALARRFRTVLVSEPSLEQTREIINNIRHRLERNYSVKFTNESIKTVLELAPRYQRHLRLPDKPIGWLDTAAVRVELAGHSEVNKSDIVAVIADTTGLPLDMIVRDVSDRFRDIENALGERVIGQKHAIRSVADRLRLNKGPLKDGFDRPDGVLFFLGPTGVGKTELAKALAEFLFGSDKKMIRIDMSEFQGGEVSVSKLIGMTRGIVGSEHGGVFTNQLKDNPYSVILLDEIEKTTPDVLNLFLQAFDEGWLTDGRGRRVYLSDSIVIMTSNIGSKHFKKLTNPMGFQASVSVNPSEIAKEVKRDFDNHFSPEFRNRIDEVVIFDPLTHDQVRSIASKEIAKVRETLAKLNKILDISDDVLEKIIQLGFSYQYGARFLKRVIDEKIKIPISGRMKKNTFRFIIKNGAVELVTDQQQLAYT